MDRIRREGGVSRRVRRAPGARRQASGFGGTRLFVLPSTSPANAAVPWDRAAALVPGAGQGSRPMPRPGRARTVLDARPVLLFRYPTAADPGVWVAPGGALEPGETHEQALGGSSGGDSSARGRARAVDLEAAHVWTGAGAVYDTREQFAVVRVNPRRRTRRSDSLFFGGPGTGFEHRWWTAGELEETRTSVSPRARSGCCAICSGTAHRPSRSTSAFKRLWRNTVVPPGRAARPDAASSVAPIARLSGLPASLPRNEHRAPTTNSISPKPLSRASGS